MRHTNSKSKRSRQDSTKVLPRRDKVLFVRGTQREAETVTQFCKRKGLVISSFMLNLALDHIKQIHENGAAR
jgi:hypothetical protein